MRKKLRDDISLEQIIETYKKEKDGRIKERLLTIKLLYEGKGVSDIAKQIDVSRKTIYNWIDAWNQNGHRGLKPGNERSGKKRYLDKEEWQEILSEIEGRGYTIKDILRYVKKTRGKTYTYKGIWKALHEKDK